MMALGWRQRSWYWIQMKVKEGYFLITKPGRLKDLFAGWGRLLYKNSIRLKAGIGKKTQVFDRHERYRAHYFA